MKKRLWIIIAVCLLAVSLVFNLVLLWRYHTDGSENSIISEGQTEEYVYVAVFSEDPMIKLQDEKGLQEFAAEMGVKATLRAPETYDPAEQVRILEEVIDSHPAGIMVCGSDDNLTPLINRAIAEGIPTITVDADLPDSDRLASVGSDWFNIGVRQGEAMMRLIGGKGKVAMLGMVGSENMGDGFEGFRSVAENYDDVIVLGEYDDMTNPDEARRIVLQLIEDHPDLAGIAGFDSNSGPGIAEAIKELGLAGKIKVTCVDIAPVHLQLVRDGYVQKLIGQKRELFTYYGGKLLYDINHSNLTVTNEDEKNGITNIPEYVDTGLVEVDITNVDDIIR